MAVFSRCPQCGSVSGGVGLPGLCPACLLGLALAVDEEVEPDDAPILPGAVYRVLTVLSSEDDRTTYLAEQDQTRRLVTLEVVRLPSVGGDDGLARCRERLRALRRFEHAGVPRIIDGRRTASGEFCVVAHHANGPRIDRVCETRQLAPDARARLFRAVCEIISDGHRHGVCHGRLRPDLVIVSGTRDAILPIILGYSVIPDRTPTIEDDLAGLDALARAMGWQGPDGPTCSSVDGLRDAASTGWRRMPSP